jgi:3-oxoacyl-[acyl-carrier-protein] synthase-1
MKNHFFLNDLGIINALGDNKSTVLKKLLRGSREGLKVRTTGQGTFTVASVAPESPAPIPELYDNRLNRLLANACDQIRPAVSNLISRYGSGRIGVVLGSTDNGSEQSLEALRVFQETLHWPKEYTFFKQEAQHSSAFVKEYLSLGGPACNISTACTSSARAIVYARTLLELGVCDGVIAGGADIVSESVLLGFHSLEAIDREPCNPFSKNRKGINLGEGAALFVVTREAASNNNIRLAGCGESSDAYHMTAPDPEGLGASAAMHAALKDARMEPPVIDYINLHGTGTDLNDRMESIATNRVFPDHPPASSTKTMVGHTLGAAGAIELGFCWLVLNSGDSFLPPHLWDNERDNDLPSLFLIPPQYKVEKLITCMSNSYAFGGCNVSLIITRGEQND